VSHDPSEIILIYLFDAQETFLIIIDVENSWADSFSLMNKKSKRTVFIFKSYCPQIYEQECDKITLKKYLTLMK